MSYYKESPASKLSQGTVHRAGKAIGFVWSPAVMWTGSRQDTKPVQRTCSAFYSRKKYMDINSYLMMFIIKYIPNRLSQNGYDNTLFKCPLKSNNEKCPKSFPSSVQGTRIIFMLPFVQI